MWVAVAQRQQRRVVGTTSGPAAATAPASWWAVDTSKNSPAGRRHARPTLSTDATNDMGTAKR